jgi:XTP/dITP diphosphohydrolase
MELWLASGNKGKLSEFQQLLNSLPQFELHNQSELSYFSQPPETGETFTDNARIKARALHALVPTAWVVADDSGLVVPGLGGLPGVHSARYAGPKARDSENNAKLLKMMQIRCNSQRQAHFECCLCAIDPQGKEHLFVGQLQGSIAHQARGGGGFGYDPVFIPEGWEHTLAERPASEKNAISHRAGALKQLMPLLKDYSE